MMSQPTEPKLRNLARSIALALIVVTSGAVGAGCAYSGMASTPDGNVVIARNGLLGANRKIFVCRVGADSTLKCVETASPP